MVRVEKLTNWVGWGWVGYLNMLILGGVGYGAGSNPLAGLPGDDACQEQNGSGKVVVAARSPCDGYLNEDCERDTIR